MNVMRRLRGIVGTIGIWTAAFTVAGAGGLFVLLALGALPPFELTRFLRTLVVVSVRWAFLGAGMGLAFAGAVLLGERKRTLIALSPRRFAAWGFVAGAIVPMGVTTVYVLAGRSSIAINLRTGLIFAGICGAVGAALAAVSLRAARRAPLSRDETPRVRVPLIQ
jgi:hypothetical protein